MHAYGDASLLFLINVIHLSYKKGFGKKHYSKCSHFIRQVHKYAYDYEQLKLLISMVSELTL